MKKIVYGLLFLCVSALCFAAAKDGSILTYNLEYFADGTASEIEFYVTDSSVEISRFDKQVLNAKKGFDSDNKLKGDLSDDFSYRFRIDFYYGKGGKKSYYLKNGFDVYDCKNKVFLELDELKKNIYGTFSSYAVEHFYRENALKKNKLGTKRVCFYLDSRPFALESTGEICDRGDILFFDCDLRNAPKIVKEVRNSTRIPNGFAIKEALLEGCYIMEIYAGDKIEKTYKIVNSKNVFDDSGNLRKAAIADELLVMAVEFMIASWL